MKRWVLLVCSIVFVLLSVNAKCATINNFAVSTETYSIYSDVEGIVDNLFGLDYRLADWNDIVGYYQEGNNMSLFTNMIPGRTMVSYNGEEFYSSDRHYFINISDHNTPSDFLVHAHIDDHLIDLGSWNNDRYILAYTENPVPIPGALWLFGSGFISLLGLRRYFLIS